MYHTAVPFQVPFAQVLRCLPFVCEIVAALWMLLFLSPHDHNIRFDFSVPAPIKAGKARKALDTIS
jgi:hypothetical protein